MSRTLYVAIAAAVIGLALALAGLAPAASTPKTVEGSVGPGFTIGLQLGVKKGTALKHGTYRFVISDKSSIHDFHLTGPGLDRTITTVDFTGTKSIVLTLKKGTYRYLCDPHASFMHGSFRVA